MKKLNLLVLALAISMVATSCKKEDEIVEDPVDSETNIETGLTELSDGSQTLTGNLSDGEILDDLSWAWTSSMACFVEPVKAQFKGNHVFYQIDLPSHSTIDIYLKPTNENDNMSLYAYSIGANSKTLPPDISSCVSCEADPSANSGLNAPEPGERHVYLNAITNPYSIIIGVAGEDGLTAGEYTLEIVIES